jgi:hypothetical protein
VHERFDMAAVATANVAEPIDDAARLFDTRACGAWQLVAWLDPSPAFGEEVAAALRWYVLEARNEGMRREVWTDACAHAIAVRTALVLYAQWTTDPIPSFARDLDPEVDFVRSTHFVAFRAALRDALVLRPPDDHAVLEMRFLEGRSSGDVRARLGVVRTNRALAPEAMSSVRACVLESVATALRAQPGGDEPTLSAVLDCERAMRSRFAGSP